MQVLNMFLEDPLIPLEPEESHRPLGRLARSQGLVGVIFPSCGYTFKMAEARLLFEQLVESRYVKLSGPAVMCIAQTPVTGRSTSFCCSPLE